MSESSRRIHAAARQAVTALNDYTEDDVRWTETRTIALMLTGVTFVNAVDQAAQECSKRIYDRVLLQEMRDRQRSEARAAYEAQATLGQRPTLKTSLGDLLAARVRK